MRKNREKFVAVVGRVRDLKARFFREVDAATKGAVETERRSVRRVAATVLSEGKWLASVCERKLLANKQPITKDEEKRFNAAKAFFDAATSEYEEVIHEHGFVESLDALFIVHMESLASVILRLDAADAAKRAKAVADAGLAAVSDDEPEEEEETEDEEAAAGV